MTTQLERRTAQGTVPPHNVEAEMADEVELRPATAQLLRQFTVMELMGKPLPVVRRINDPIRKATL